MGADPCPDVLGLLPGGDPTLGGDKAGFFCSFSFSKCYFKNCFKRLCTARIKLATNLAFPLSVV